MWFLGKFLGLERGWLGGFGALDSLLLPVLCTEESWNEIVWRDGGGSSIRSHTPWV